MLRGLKLAGFGFNMGVDLSCKTLAAVQVRLRLGERPETRRTSLSSEPLGKLYSTLETICKLDMNNPTEPLHN